MSVSNRIWLSAAVALLALGVGIMLSSIFTGARDARSEISASRTAPLEREYDGDSLTIIPITDDGCSLRELLCL